MRHQKLKGLASILAVVMTCAVLPWAHAQGAGPVIPGVSLADIPLGTRIAELIQRLGAPSELRLVSADGTLAYVFSQYGITAYTRANVIAALTTTNSVLGTIKGIGLGTAQETVIAAFGVPRGTSLVEGLPGLTYEDQGIAFGFSRQAVAVVMVFPRVPSATPSTVPPAAPSPPVSPLVTSQVDTDGASAPSTTSPSTSTEAPAAAAGPTAPESLVTSNPSTSTAVPAVAAGPTAPESAFRSNPSGAAIAGSISLPDVSRLHPFSADTLFLSLAGYLRYLAHAMTGLWAAAESIEEVIRPAWNPARP